MRRNSGSYHRVVFECVRDSSTTECARVWWSLEFFVLMFGSPTLGACNGNQHLAESEKHRIRTSRTYAYARHASCLLSFFVVLVVLATESVPIPLIIPLYFVLLRPLINMGGQRTSWVTVKEVMALHLHGSSPTTSRWPYRNTVQCRAAPRNLMHLMYGDFSLFNFIPTFLYK